METELITSERTVDELAIQLRESLQSMEDSGRETVKHAIECGQYLIDIKSQLKHGEFLPWLADNFGHISRSHASRLMKLAVANVARVQHLESATSIREALEMVKEAEKAERKEWESDKPEREDQSEESEMARTLVDGIKDIEAAGVVTHDDVRDILGMSKTTRTASAALQGLVDLGDEYKVTKEDEGFRVQKRPEKQEAILAEFERLTPKEKMAMLKKLHLDEDVRRINGARNTQKMKKGGDPDITSFEAVSRHVTKAEHGLHSYATHYGHDFRWLGSALKSDEGTKVILGVIARLEDVAERAGKYAEELNRRTSDV